MLSRSYFPFIPLLLRDLTFYHQDKSTISNRKKVLFEEN